MLKDCICKTCKAEFKGGPRAWYCLSCRNERKAKADKACKERQRHNSTRAIGSNDACVKCGELYIVNSGLQRYCKNCAPTALLENDREQGLEYYKSNKDLINLQRRENRRKEYEAKMDNKEYCTNKGSNCGECYLASYGRDCKNKVIRSDAQKAADKRYRERNASKETSVSFYMTTTEAAEIKAIIGQSGLTNVGFLRKAIELYKQGKFD